MARKRFLATVPADGFGSKAESQLLIWVTMIAIISTLGCGSAETRLEGRWVVDIESTYRLARDSVGTVARMTLSELLIQLDGLEVTFSSPDQVTVKHGQQMSRQRFRVLASKGESLTLLIMDRPETHRIGAQFSKGRLWLLQGLDAIALERK